MVVRRRADMPARVRITSMLPEANAALLAALAEARGAR
jgi:histidinol-phosphate/aromatic aminotransferase/cobyric acid decarboxylase-like protein